MLKISKNESKRLSRLRATEQSKGCCPDEVGTGGGIYGGSGVSPEDTVAQFTNSFQLTDDPEGTFSNGLILNSSAFGGLIDKATGTTAINPDYPDQQMMDLLIPGALPILSPQFLLNTWAGIPGDAIDQSSTRISTHVDPVEGDALIVIFGEMWKDGKDSDVTTVVGAEHYRGTGISTAEVKASADGNSTASALALLYASHDTTGVGGDHHAQVLAQDKTGTIGGELIASMGYQEFGGDFTGLIINNASGFSVGNDTAGTNYFLPLVRGTVNQILTTDGSGNVTWQDTVDSLGGQQTALTSEDASVIDATYDAVEQGVLNNVRTRLAELETKLQTLGLIA